MIHVHAAPAPEACCRFICWMSLQAVRWPASQCFLWQAALQYTMRLHALHRLSARLGATLAHSW